MTVFSSTRIPCPRIITYNISSLSSMASTAKGQRRRHRVIATIKSLLGQCEILCLQETWLGKKNDSELKKEFPEPEYYIKYNNDRKGHGGTIIIIKKEVTDNYQMEDVNLGDKAAGRVQGLFFKSKAFPKIPKASFSVGNVYLTSGKGAGAERIKQLKIIRGFNKEAHLYLVGDFNMTENPEDSPTGTSYLHGTKDERDDWRAIKEEMGLHEHHQEDHTHYNVTEDINHCRTSRIDRIYSTLGDTDFLLRNPICYIAPGGGKAYDAFQVEKGMEGASERFRRAYLSDHMPVVLAFVSGEASKRRAPNLPKWAGAIKGIGAKRSQL